MTAQIAILTGTTASGKTALALDLAARHGAIEIINADSLLVYRGMDIGTAKPTAEERARVPHHLIDIREPNEPHSAGDFHRAALAAIDEIESRGHRALIVGGTGFYLKALLFGLWEAPKSDPALRAELQARPTDQIYRELFARDEVAALKIGANDRYRLIRGLEISLTSTEPLSALQSKQNLAADPRFELWVLDRASDDLERRIEERTCQMLTQGLIEETRAVRARHPDSRALGSVGYAEVCRYLDGVLPAGRKLRPDLEGLSDEIRLATRQLVKSQRTFFRGLLKQAGLRDRAHSFELERERALAEARFDATYSLKS